MGENLMSSKAYVDHGYVVKQDLINVYKNGDIIQDDYILMLIQAPQGSIIEIPRD